MLGYRNVLFIAPGTSSPTTTMKRAAALVEKATAARRHDSGRDAGRASGTEPDEPFGMTVFGVIPEASGLKRLRERFGRADDVLAAQCDAERARLGKAVARAGLPDVAVEVEIGNPALAVVQRVIRDRHDLLVVALGDDEADHAAVVRRILRKCPAPVWLVRPTRARKRRILAAVDVQSGSTDFTMTILRTAADLYRITGGELHVLHAWELFGEETMRHSAFMQIPAGEINAMIEAEAAERTEALHALLRTGDIADLPWTVHVDKGDPADTLVSAVDRLRITTLVMGTVARTGIPGLLIGNTAETVLDRARCSVLAVKPSDFRSPIRVDEATAGGP